MDKIYTDQRVCAIGTATSNVVILSCGFIIKCTTTYNYRTDAFSQKMSVVTRHKVKTKLEPDFFQASFQDVFQDEKIGLKILP